MNNLVYQFDETVANGALEMVFVPGTNGTPFLFGVGNEQQHVHIKSFFIAKFPVTQSLWKHVTGSTPSHFKGENCPVENVSWLDIKNEGGFLEMMNNSVIIKEMKKQLSRDATPAFRLPSETEWEYAARGGRHWTDNLIFSGSNDADEVAWYEKNSGKHTWPVGLKAANQLGIYDMCGNVWEWCEDIYTTNVGLIPADGTPFLGRGNDRVLRGGCHHNWAVHCTATKRYEITPGAADECIGLRLALSI